MDTDWTGAESDSKMAPRRIVEGISDEQRQWMDARNERKKQLRNARRLAGKTPDVVRQDVVHKMMCSVICKVKRMAADRSRRRDYVSTHKEQEAVAAKKRNDEARAQKKAAPASTNKRGNYNAVVKIAAAAVSHTKAMAKDRDRAKKNAQENRPRINARKCERLRDDEQYAVTARLRCRLANFVRDKGYKKSANTEELVGKSYEKTTCYLKGQMLSGEKLIDLEIDHIFPMAAYDLRDEEMQKRCMNWSNLQPLTAAENLEKNDRMPTKQMAAKVNAFAWPPGVTMEQLPDRYSGWKTGLRK